MSVYDVSLDLNHIQWVHTSVQPHLKWKMIYRCTSSKLSKWCTYQFNFHSFICDFDKDPYIIPCQNFHWIFIKKKKNQAALLGVMLGDEMYNYILESYLTTKSRGYLLSSSVLRMLIYWDRSYLAYFTPPNTMVMLQNRQSVRHLYNIDIA